MANPEVNFYYFYNKLNNKPIKDLNKIYDNSVVSQTLFPSGFEEAHVRPLLGNILPPSTWAFLARHESMVFPLDCFIRQ